MVLCRLTLLLLATMCVACSGSAILGEAPTAPAVADVIEEVSASEDADRSAPDGGEVLGDDAVDDALSPAPPPLSLGPSRCEVPAPAPETTGRQDVTPVVTFNELMYHPVQPNYEWLELRNEMRVDVDISGWRLEGAVRFTFPDGTLLSGGHTLVVANDPASLATGTWFSGALGPYEGKLSNSGERLELHNNAGRLMDVVDYDDDAPWPVTPDGSGVSLAKRGPHLPSWDPGGWVASAELGGTPGSDNFPDPLAAPETVQLVGPGALWRLQVDGTEPAEDWAAPDFDDAAWEEAAGPILVGVEPTQGVEVVATADNHFAVYLGESDGGGLRLLGRDGEGTWTTAETFADTAGPGDHLFVAAWEPPGDSGSPQMLIAEALGGSEVLIHTDAQSFEVALGPAGANPGGELSGPAPTAAAIATQVTASDSADGWTSPQAERAKGEGPWGGQVGAAFEAAAFLWYDTFAGNSVTNQQETYALFRSLTPVLPPMDELNLMAAPQVARFRTDFQVESPASVASLRLTGLVDSGAVIYLNGAEIARVALPEGPLDETSLALSAGEHDVGTVDVPVDLLSDGDNVLAVAVHQSGPEDTSLVLSLSLTATRSVADASPPSALVLSEVSAGGQAPSWAELLNRGEGEVSLSGHTLGRADGLRHPLPEATLGPGERIVIGGHDLTLTLEPDHLLVLRGPEDQVLDGVRVTDVVRGVNSDGVWGHPVEGTPGGPNAFTPRPPVVFNEAMYHAPPVVWPDGSAIPDGTEWLELYNTGDVAIDLAGFRLVGGVAFVFESGSVLPGRYVVVSATGERPPGTPEDTGVLGPWQGRLSNRGDGVTLLDACGNPVDRLDYRDGGRWPSASDGVGASLERRLAGASSASPETWGASVEADRVDWEVVSYRAVAQPSSVGPDGQWRELVVGLLDAGEVLVDDLSVVQDPDGAAVQLIQDPGFDDPDAASWRWIGTHRHSERVSDPEDPSETVLRLVATGPAEHMHNHLETTFASGLDVQNGVEYEISYRARWVSGSNQLNTRLYFNRLARTTRLSRSSAPGTPGAPNTLAVDTLGPALDDLQHHPVVPGPEDPVAVSITARDPEGVASVTLWTSLDGGPFTSHPMTLGESGRYQALLEPLPSGTIVQLVVIAQDATGAESAFPADAEGSRALYKVSEPVGDTHGKRTIRIWMTPADDDWFHAAPNVMSNDRVGATVVYDDREVFYDVGVRAKGSERGRVQDYRLGFGVYFNADQPFRGAYGSVMIDRSQGVNFGQREWLLNQAMARGGSVSAEYNDLVHLVAPRAAHTSSAELQLARFGNTMLDAQFDGGAAGQLFEYELVYFPTTTDDGTAEGQKLPQPDQVVGTALGAPWADEEDYRHVYLAKNNRGADEYTLLVARLGLFDLPDSAFFTDVEGVLDVDQWLRAFAFASLAGVTDQFASGAAHNAQIYVRPEDGRLLYFPHDLDFFFGNPTQGLVSNGVLNRLLQEPAYKRAFCGHVNDFVQTSYNADYMAHWGAHMGALVPEQTIDSYVTFLANRAQHLMYDAGDAVTKLVPPVDFAITTHDGTTFTVPDVVVTLEGQGWVDVHTIVRLGEQEGTPLEVTWLDTTTWQVTVSLNPGVNIVALEAHDRRGQSVGQDGLFITSELTDP